MTSSNEGALAGVRVVDLSRVYAGPFCAQTLADHGADVIKIEPPQGDETRDWGPAMPNGISSYYWGLNRNKRNLALDLSHPDGRDVLFRVLETADVLIDNFKQGTLERWGIGYEDCLRALSAPRPLLDFRLRHRRPACAVSGLRRGRAGSRRLHVDQRRTGRHAAQGAVSGR